MAWTGPAAEAFRQGLIKGRLRVAELNPYNVLPEEWIRHEAELEWERLQRDVWGDD